MSFIFRIPYQALSYGFRFSLKYR